MLCGSFSIKVALVLLLNLSSQQIEFLKGYKEIVSTLFWFLLFTVVVVAFDYNMEQPKESKLKCIYYCSLSNK